MKYLISTLFLLCAVSAYGQKGTRNPKNTKTKNEPMTETMVTGKWYVIVNKQTGRSRKALCSLPFNIFEFCGHPGERHSLTPGFTINLHQSCECEDTHKNNQMIVRIATKKLHEYAWKDLNNVKVSGDTLRINLHKNQTATISLNYKGESFASFRNIKKNDALPIDTDVAFNPEKNYINFADKKAYIPSKEFPILDSTIYAMKLDSNLMISIFDASQKGKAGKTPNTLIRYRSELIKRYLIQSGINSSRIQMAYTSDENSINLKAGLSEAKNCIGFTLQ